MLLNIKYDHFEIKKPKQYKQQVHSSRLAYYNITK